MPRCVERVEIGRVTGNELARRRAPRRVEWRRRWGRGHAAIVHTSGQLGVRNTIGGSKPILRNYGCGVDPNAEGANTILTSGEAYDSFMGRYSRPLAPVFADAAGVAAGQVALDIGCGPGALTGLLVDRLGPSAVSACDPSAPFVAACSQRHPSVDVRLGRAEQLPFPDAQFDRAMAQLVLHFVTDPFVAALEAKRVLRLGDIVAACVWDFAEGMEMLRRFWDAALLVAPDAPDEARLLRFGGAGEIRELLDSAGFLDTSETVLQVSTTYSDYDELWAGFLAGIGPAGSFCVALPEDQRTRLRANLFRGIGSPAGTFTLSASARCAIGRKPPA